MPTQPDGLLVTVRFDPASVGEVIRETGATDAGEICLRLRCETESPAQVVYKFCPEHEATVEDGLSHDERYARFGAAVVVVWYLTDRGVLRSERYRYVGESAYPGIYRRLQLVDATLLGALTPVAVELSALQVVALGKIAVGPMRTLIASANACGCRLEDLQRYPDKVPDVLRQSAAGCLELCSPRERDALAAEIGCQVRQLPERLHWAENLGYSSVLDKE